MSSSPRSSLSLLLQTPSRVHALENDVELELELELSSSRSSSSCRVCVPQFKLEFGRPSSRSSVSERVEGRVRDRVAEFEFEVQSWTPSCRVRVRVS